MKIITFRDYEKNTPISLGGFSNEDVDFEALEQMSNIVSMVRPGALEFIKPPEELYDFGKPTLGIYAGSFNPFHKGHLNVAQKAAKLFDRLSVVQAWDGSKAKPTCNLHEIESLQGYMVQNCDRLLTDFIKQNFSDFQVTIVRGLRNVIDLQSEISLLRFYQDLLPDIQVVHIVCDREYEHLSSTAIRQLQVFGKGKEYLA